MLRFLARVLEVLSAHVNTMLLIVVVSMVFSCAPAHSKCRANDSWHGTDKQLHFGGGAVIATLITVHTADPWTGFYTGAGTGLLKEAVDATGAGDCSLQDFLITTAGAALGAYTGSVIVTRLQGRTLVAYAKTF